MQTDLRPRNYLVSTAGFVLGSLGLLLSIFTAFLGHDAVLALTRKLDRQDDSGQPSARPREPVRRLRRVASDSSLVTHRPLIPTISVTLHQTGNSISSTRHLISITAPTPPASPPARRSTVSFAPPQPPQAPPPPARPRSPESSKEQWLSLPPIQTRTKRRRKHTLNRSTSSPQLSSLAAAGVTFAPPPATADTDTDGERKRGKMCLRIKKSGERDEGWESVYLNEEGSPNTMAAPLPTPVPEAKPVALPNAQESPDNNPRRPKLRKAKTLGDLLRRVPNSPGPSLPNPEQLESSTKQAFAFASCSKSKGKSPPQAEKEPKFSLYIKSPKSRAKSKEDLKTRKRTQPYEAPYYWVPPDQVMALNARNARSSTEKGKEAMSVKSAPISRVTSQEIR